MHLCSDVYARMRMIMQTLATFVSANFRERALREVAARLLLQAAAERSPA
jgi:hypothetical protein